MDDRTQAQLATVQNRLRNFARLVRDVGLSIQGALVLRGLADPLREYAKAEQILGRLDTVFGSLSGEALKFSEALAKGINESKFEVVDAVSQFQAVFQGFGFTQSSSFGLSKFFAEAAFDLKAFDDTIANTQEAIDTLQSGIAGEVRPVRRAFGADVGLEARNSAVETLKAINSIKDGQSPFTNIKVDVERLSKSFRDLGEQQQFVIARALLMGDALRRAGVTGQALREVATLEARYRGAAAAFRDARIELGRQLRFAGAGVILTITNLLKATEAWLARSPALTNALAILIAGLGSASLGMVGLSISINAAMFAMTPFSIVAKGIAGAMYGLGLAAATFSKSILLAARSMFLFVVTVPAIAAIRTLRTALTATSLVLTGLGTSILFVASRVVSLVSVVIRLIGFISSAIQVVRALGIAFTAFKVIAVLGPQILVSLAPLLPLFVGISAAIAVLAVTGPALYAVFTEIGRALTVSGRLLRTAFIDGIQASIRLLGGLSVVARTAFNSISESLGNTNFFANFKSQLVESFKSIGEAISEGDFKAAMNVLIATARLAGTELKIIFENLFIEAGPQFEYVLKRAALEFQIAMIKAISAIHGALSTIIAPIVDVIDAEITAARILAAQWLSDDRREGDAEAQRLQRERNNRITALDNARNNPIAATAGLIERFSGVDAQAEGFFGALRDKLANEFNVGANGLPAQKEIPLDVQEKQQEELARANRELQGIRGNIKANAEAAQKERDAAAQAKVDESFLSEVAALTKSQLSSISSFTSRGSFGSSAVERMFANSENDLARLVSIAANQLKTEKEIEKAVKAQGNAKLVFQ